jgi:type IV pilus assembly protein PilO
VVAHAAVPSSGAGIVPSYQDYDKNFFDLFESHGYVFIGLLVLVFILDFFLLMHPQISTLTKIGPEIEQLQKDIDKVKDDSGRINDYKKTVENLRSKADILNLSVKSKSEFPIILERVSTIASENGIKIDQIIPNTEKQELLLDKNNRKYYSLPINVDAEGGYHNLGRFINKIENDAVALQVGSFTLASSAASLKNHKIKMVLQATVYEEGSSDKGAAKK